MGTLPGKQCYTDRVTLASGAKTTTATGGSYEIPGGISGVGICLDLTAAATSRGDTLDVWVQTTLDGTNWVDIVRFAQCIACVPTSLVTAGNGAGAGVQEIQLIDIPTTVTGGTFTLTFNNETTGSLNWNDSAATVDTALEALTGIGASGVAVVLTSGQYLVTWAATGPQYLLSFHDHLVPATEIAAGGTKTLYAKVTAGTAETAFANSTALASGAVRNLIGSHLRARWAIADEGADNASFTFTVVASPM